MGQGEHMRWMAGRSGLAICFALLLQGCEHEVPSSGIYVSERGDLYDARPGPAALTLTSADRKLCLMFWEYSDEKTSWPTQAEGGAKNIRLRGQECTNRTIGALDWGLSFASEDRQRFTLYPPAAVGAGKPLRLKRLRDS